VDKRTPEKKERLLTALDKGMTMIHLDARRPGVLVPTHLKGESHLLLNLSYRFEPPDLTVGEWGIRSTLTFHGSRFTVAVPWSALYAISSHVTKEFWMYPDDMPKELLQAAVRVPSPLEGEGEVEAGGEKGDVEEKSRGILREVASEPASNAGDDEGPKEPPRRGHLRIVK
jgi:stringent starvation protein B